MTDTKICYKCKIDLSFECFSKNRTTKDGLQTACKSCQSLYYNTQMSINPDHVRTRTRQSMKRLRDKDPEKYNKYQRNLHLKTTYNLSPEEYELLLEKQNGVCAICFQKCVSGRRLAVDHDHLTNQNRGLLCCKCNRGLGNFDDSIELLQKALDYLIQL